MKCPICKNEISPTAHNLSMHEGEIAHAVCVRKIQTNIYETQLNASFPNIPLEILIGLDNEGTLYKLDSEWCAIYKNHCDGIVAIHRQTKTKMVEALEQEHFSSDGGWMFDSLWHNGAEYEYNVEIKINIKKK